MVGVLKLQHTMARSLYNVHHQPERIREESKIIDDGKLS